VTIAVGDRVICRRNDTDVDVDNGTRGTVRATHKDRAVIQTDAGMVRDLPTGYVAEHVEYAYCLTGHGGAHPRAPYHQTWPRACVRVPGGKVARGEVMPRCPGELSYRRAEELLVGQTGWTLHQFRHLALTHLAEADVQLPLLMAKSRHRSLMLQRDALPGPDAVAALTAAHDLGRRR
jgi:hypothetical protein